MLLNKFNCASLRLLIKTLMRNIIFWASLVAQWLRICLPMKGILARDLVREYPTCREAPKPMCHNY